MKSMKACWIAFALCGAPLVAGCAPAGPIQEDSISEGGGFLDPEQRLASEPEPDYCAAEVLRFRYDDLTETLRLADGRLLLSCCGQRSVTVQRVDSLLEVTERDDPDGGRCDPVCAYDFTVAVPGVPTGHLAVRLLRDVTDAQGGPTLVWRGELDLPGDPGSVVLDDLPAPGCRDARHEPPPARRPPDGLTDARAEALAR
jgi:hypothetical protein